jgi:hypothetical protein
VLFLFDCTHGGCLAIINSCFSTFTLAIVASIFQIPMFTFVHPATTHTIHLTVVEPLPPSPFDVTCKNKRDLLPLQTRPPLFHDMMNGFSCDSVHRPSRIVEIDAVTQASYEKCATAITSIFPPPCDSPSRLPNVLVYFSFGDNFPICPSHVPTSQPSICSCLVS